VRLVLDFIVRLPAALTLLIDRLNGDFGTSQFFGSPRASSCLGGTASLDFYQFK
jgi:hypothetical protein